MFHPFTVSLLLENSNLLIHTSFEKMSKYTLEQRQKIVEIYHEHKSFAKTRQICRQLFGDEMVPNYLTIKRYLEKLDEYGHLENLKQWCYVRIGRKHIVKAERKKKSPKTSLSGKKEKMKNVSSKTKSKISKKNKK